MKPRRYWQGYLSGTNRGEAFAVIGGVRKVLRAKVLLYDQAYGPTILTLEGKLDGVTAALRLVRARSWWAPVRPLDGAVSVTFSEGGKAAQGTWQTDIGTSGVVQLRLAPFWRVRWFGRWLAIFWRRYLPTFYAVGMLTLVLVSALLGFRISWQALLLLLVPAVPLFENRIAAIVMRLKIQKLGPIEFQQQQLPAPATVPPPPAFVGDCFPFAAFDVDFVPRTKLVLIWLFLQGAAAREAFDAAAKRIGVEGEYLENTFKVLVGSGCIVVEDKELAASSLGARYVTYLLATLAGRKGH